MLSEYLGCSSGVTSLLWKINVFVPQISLCQHFWRFKKNDKLLWVNASGDSCILLLNISGAMFGTDPIYIATRFCVSFCWILCLNLKWLI